MNFPTIEAPGTLARHREPRPAVYPATFSTTTTARVVLDIGRYVSRVEREAAEARRLRVVNAWLWLALGLAVAVALGLAGLLFAEAGQ